MGREVRRVPANWQHPKDEFGSNIPLLGGSYSDAAKEFLDKANAEGLESATDYFGGAPTPDQYMPEWPESERTNYMMYETTSEGTPISPAFATPEELARWLADTGASAFGYSTASYEAWLRVANGAYAPSAVYTPEHGLQSGVEAL